MFGEQLGHCPKALVVLWEDIAFFPLGEHVVLGGGEEGHVVGVHPGEKAVVGPAELRAGHPLQGSKVVLQEEDPNLSRV